MKKPQESNYDQNDEIALLPTVTNLNTTLKNP